MPPSTEECQAEREFFQFLRCALAAGNCQQVQSEQGTEVYRLPEELSTPWQEAGWLEGNHIPVTPEAMAQDSCDLREIATWLFEHYRSEGVPIHAAPVDQPQQIHELTDQLFQPYTVEGGNVHLGGCTLEDRLLLKLFYRSREDHHQSGPPIASVVLKEDGSSIEPFLAEWLCQVDLAPPTPAPEVISAEQQVDFYRLAEQHLATLSQSHPKRLLGVMALWCRWAQGKLVFTLGDKSVEVPFSGWASLLAQGKVLPPPLMCEESACQSYHLAATDEGYITAAESIAECAVTGRRLLAVHLRPCGVSGQLALPEEMVTCPVSGRRVIPSTLTKCVMCGQEVARDLLRSERCLACRRLERVERSDLRLARILGEFPGLEQWRKWRLHETHRDYLLLATTLWRQLIVVLDKSDLSVRRTAERSRFSRLWTELAPGEVEEMFRQ